MVNQFNQESIFLKQITVDPKTLLCTQQPRQLKLPIDKEANLEIQPVIVINPLNGKALQANSKSAIGIASATGDTDIVSQFGSQEFAYIESIGIHIQNWVNTGTGTIYIQGVTSGNNYYALNLGTVAVAYNADMNLCMKLALPTVEKLKIVIGATVLTSGVVSVNVSGS